MNYCKGCGKPIHETAPSCPHCGAPQSVLSTVLNTHEHQAPVWTSITGLVFSIIPVLSMFAPKDWNNEEALGAMLFATVALVLGIVSLVKKHRGGGMAIAAVVMGAIGFLAALGAMV